MTHHVPSQKISIILPAKNEARGLSQFLPQLRRLYADFEIIVVNDGSTDETALIAQQHGVTVINHPYPMGNGAAMKTGARAARGEIYIFMDADNQHRPQDIAVLLTKLHEGYDMVVGARNRNAQANLLRWFGNSFYNCLASCIVNQKVEDLTSGFRAVYAQKFKEFLYLLPNGFSSPSTITMAFFRTGYSIAYVPITVQQREGASHLKPFSDGVRFLIIIYKMTILYSPLKVLLPLAILHFIAGMCNYAYTYFSFDRFTNMSAVLLSVSVIIFFIGLLSEQITTLMYQHTTIPERRF